MSSNLHIKPTQPYGYLNFAKNGKVTEHVFELSDNKESQETTIAKEFVNALNQSQKKNLTYLRNLPENDQDALLNDSQGVIELQIAELVNYSFAIPIVDGKEITNPFGKRVKLLRDGGVIYTEDLAKKDVALLNVIKGKVNKHYAKSEGQRLWLLVYSLSLYETIFVQEGQYKKSKGLQIAQEYLNLTRHPFDEIWFLFPNTNPIQIY